MSNGLNEHRRPNTKQVGGTLDRSVIDHGGRRVTLEAHVAQVKDGQQDLEQRVLVLLRDVDRVHGTPDLTELGSIVDVLDGRAT